MDCLLLLPLFVGTLCLVFVLLLCTLCMSSFAIISMNWLLYFSCLPDVLCQSVFCGHFNTVPFIVL